MRKKFNDKEINLSVLDKLEGKTVSLAASVQYLDLILKIKKYLESKGKKVIIKQGSFHKAQVLGCQSFAFDSKADILLLLADGKFHAINNAVELSREIFIFNTKTIEKITKEEIEKIKARTKAKISKFLMNDKIGLIISSKPGQRYNNYIEIEKKLENKGKQVYLFEADNINPQELENFPIEIWINTACPGLSSDSSKILNLRDVVNYI